MATHDGLYPDVRDGLVQLSEGDVWKYGTTIDPGGRYPPSAVAGLGLQMQIQSIGTAYQVLAEEKIQLIKYAVSNGSLPPGNRIFK